MKHHLIAFALVLVAVAAVHAQPTSSVQFDIYADQDVHPISPYVYGINQFHGVLDGMTGAFSNVPLVRLGGNRFTAYNWTNNGSNAGSDYHFQTDGYLVYGPYFDGVADLPGGANIPIIKDAFQHNAAALLTIPICGYVASDKATITDVRQTPDYLHTAYVLEQARKNAPFTLKPDPKSPVVYQDEFVNWVKETFPYCLTDPAHPIWFSLDNEPDWWSHTHPDIRPKPITYAELIDRTIDYASAIKDVMPGTMVFGPVNYGWQGYVRLQDAPDANNRDFQEVYLQEMAKAEKKFGKRILDVLDVHFYPEAQGGGIRVIYDPRTTLAPVIAARMQATRSLWDPDYKEDSWIVRDALHGQAIRLIPRLMEKIAKNYPGTKLAITEYEFGAGDNISGGIAQADALGVYGREGLFAAALWPSSEKMAFCSAAFEMYRNFDGKNGVFGDTSVHAQTSQIIDSSIFASLDSANHNRMVLIAINKTAGNLDASIQLHNAPHVTQAESWVLTSKNPHPVSGPSVKISDSGQFTCTMPPYSVTTLQLTVNP